MAVNYTSLASLGVYNCANLTDAAIQAIAEGCPSLTELTAADYDSPIFTVKQATFLSSLQSRGSKMSTAFGGQLRESSNPRRF